MAVVHRRRGATEAKQSQSQDERICVEFFQKLEFKFFGGQGRTNLRIDAIHFEFKKCARARRVVCQDEGSRNILQARMAVAVQRTDCSLKVVAKGVLKVKNVAHNMKAGFFEST